MARFLYHGFSRTHRRIHRLILAIFFTFGLLSGVFLFLRADNSFLFLMYRAASCRVSIIGLAATLYLPFLFSAFAVSFRRPSLLRVFAFLKALCFSYIGMGILTAYGSSGWLALPLLMFSDICSLPILWVYWLRQLGPGRAREEFHFLIWLSVIGSLDYFIISPFMASL